jgi:hypothetical protein
MSERTTVTVGNVTELNVRDYVAANPAESFSVRFGLGVWKRDLEASATFELLTAEHDRETRKRFVDTLNAQAFHDGEDATLVTHEGRHGTLAALYYADGVIEHV